MKYFEYVFKKIILSILVIIFVACSGAYDESDYYYANEINDATMIYAVIEPSAIFFDDLFIHWDDGIIQFGSMVIDDIRAFYMIENYGQYMTRLAVFSSLNVEEGRDKTEWCRPQSIFYVDVVDEWVILSAGEIQGSMGNFFGDLHRVRIDRSGREAFNLGTNDHRFVVIDGWIYNHIWCHQGGVYGWIRIRPDGTDRQSMANFIHTIILYGEDGYVYGTNAASGEGNLARWLPESNESITLFLGAYAPIFDEFFSHVSYRDIAVTDEYVYFTVHVFGEWHYSQPIGWRPFWENLHTARYRINKDGSNLILLYERYYLISIEFGLLQSVLQSEAQFTLALGLGSFYLDEYLHDEMPQVYEMAFSDLFGNGQPVVILNLDNILSLVLFYYNGKIWADEFGIRSMGGITQYGTFLWSGGLASGGVSRIERTGSEISFVNIFGRDWLWQGERFDGHVYFLYDDLISYEEFADLLERFNSKEGLNWWPFTSENISNLRHLETMRTDNLAR